MTDAPQKTPARRVLITAGPTHEPIDAVRYLANRSSGRMGIAIAEAALGAGLDVTLLLGPVSASPPPGVNTLRFESAGDLEKLLQQHFPTCDILIMAAAVADYRPAASAAGKLPRTGDRMTLELEPTPDLVAACARARRPEQRIIAFALEEPAVLARRASEKMHRKGVDAIVANPLDTMGASNVSAIIFTSDGQAYMPPSDPHRPSSKSEFARWLIEFILARLT